eukprot:CAMPEP_0115044550 /NCGR_PEP_ID=MMETSP0216-20121206/47582_1 /TAXON_ID=223996 /ORGANISM="Protocruzia adherens, Strain Boccale" /LENGTH=70 /DNA_ID=CAMNT_0002427185 /DNA_START=56 /DNA_END=268 /DNA_ORIENTATION=-
MHVRGDGPRSKLKDKMKKKHSGGGSPNKFQDQLTDREVSALGRIGVTLDDYGNSRGQGNNSNRKPFKRRR